MIHVTTVFAMTVEKIMKKLMANVFMKMTIMMISIVKERKRMNIKLSNQVGTIWNHHQMIEIAVMRARNMKLLHHLQMNMEEQMILIMTLTPLMIMEAVIAREVVRKRDQILQV